MYKIGFHTGPGGNLNGIGSQYWHKLDAASVRCVQKSVDNYGPCFEVVELIRDSGIQHVVMFRLSTAGQKDGIDYDVPKYHLPPATAASIHWQATVAKLPPEFRNDLFHKQHVWLEVINEVDKNQSDWLGQFGIHISALAMQDGYKIALFGFASGEPEPEDWETEGMLDFLSMAAEHPDKVAVALHEYSYDDDDIWAGTPFKVGRFEFLFAACDTHLIAHPTTLISEFGWQATHVPVKEEAMPQLEEAGAMYDNHNEILGVGLWYTGAEFGGIADKVQPLFEPIGNLALIWVDGEPMPPTDQEPRTLKHTIHILPQNTTPEELAAVTEYLHPTRSAFTYSHDAVEAVMSWSTPEGTIVAWDPERWNFDLEEQFAWLNVNYATDHFSRIMDTEEEFSYKLWPVPLTPAITQRWGKGDYSEFGLPGHDGVDIGVPIGTQVFSMFVGEVVRVHILDVDGWHNYGNHVRVYDPSNNELAIYAHLDETVVSKGQIIPAGYVVGLSGNSGNSTGPHLHVGRKRYNETEIDEHGAWPYNLHNPELYLKPLAPHLFPDTDPPDPPDPPTPGTKIDLLPYMKTAETNGVLYEVLTEGGGQQRHQTQGNSPVFFHTKDNEWEQLMFDAVYIYRFTDTSPGEDRYYQLRDTPGLPWSKWTRRYMAVGETYSRAPEVSFYSKSNCAPISQGFQPSLFRLDAVHSEYLFFTGVGLTDVIEVAWLDTEGVLIEKYFYAKNFGLVGWQGAGKRAAISEIHAPGQRPNNQREVISCLSSV